MTNKALRTIDDLFAETNGSARIAVALGVHQNSVDQWRRVGIPLKYWDKLEAIYGITPAELWALTKKCKELRRKRLEKK